jgi:hypothetical protein
LLFWLFVDSVECASNPDNWISATNAKKSKM